MASTENIRKRAAVSWRSLLAGIAGVLIISIAAPFNDLVLKNSAMVGGALPVAAMFLFCVLVIVINGPLSRFRPGWALQTNELAIVLSMMLVGCALPTRGLMQMWPASLVGIGQHSLVHPDDQAVFALLKLPNWFWPTGSLDRGPTDILFSWFTGGAPSNATSSQWMEIIRGWIRPVLGWGVFFVGMATAIIGLSTIVARQWIENERLTFPLCTVQLAVVEAPAPGKWLNETLRSRTFLCGAGLIAGIRILQALSTYFPRDVPAIPMSYDLRTLFESPPFSYLDEWMTSQTIYPFVTAITFFIAARISFSLWCCVVLSQIPNLIMGPMQMTMAPHRSEINLGALIAYALMILYSGRHTYLGTVKSMIFKSSSKHTGASQINRAAGYFSLFGVLLSVGWLTLLRMPVFLAILLVGSLLLIWIVMANVVARSGLIVANTLATPHEWFSHAFTNPGGLTAVNAGDVRTQFFAQLIGGLWAYNTDHLSVYTTHSLKVCHEAAPNAGRKLFFALAISLGIGFFASLSSNLWCQYHFPFTLDHSHTSPLNDEILNGQPNWVMDHTTQTMKLGSNIGRQPGSSWPWVGTSAVATGAAAFCQLRYSAWPLHPIGLLMMYSYPMRRIWFSVFLGWFIKTILLKLGGARTYHRSTGFFLGIVFGEIMMAALLGILGAAIVWAGGDFQVIPTLPTSQF
jgi:hypothetical protein